MSLKRKISRKEKQRRQRAADRQKIYRHRLKDRRKPTTDDIAITCFHFLAANSITEKARHYFGALSDRVVEDLVELGFDPVASRLAYDDLVERIERGERLKRGPKSAVMSPDISSYRLALPKSPQYSLSRRDVEKPGQSFNELITVEEASKSKLRVLRLSTAHLPDTDLQRLLEDFVFGGGLNVLGTNTTLSVQVDWQIAECDARLRDLSDRGYSEDLLGILCAATGEADVVAFDRDGPLCPELTLFEGNVPVCKAVMEAAE